MYDFCVALGCFGLRIDDFVSCSGAENVILKVNTSLPYYNEMMDYFDQCRLFDRPMFDLNAIRHFIFNMQDRYDQVTRKLWTIKKFELYQKFVIEHRHCGLFIKLQLPEGQALSGPEVPISKPEVSIVSSKASVNLSGNKLRLVRGRR